MLLVDGNGMMTRAKKILLSAIDVQNMVLNTQ